MSYSRTQARLDAENRIIQLRGPFNYAKLRTRIIPTPIRDSIYQNTIFQLSATLEDYLYQLFSGWLSRLQAGGHFNSTLPDVTRGMIVLRSVEEEFTRFLSYGDEIKMSNYLMSSVEALQSVDPLKPLPSFDITSSGVSDKKFPSKRNISSLFKRFGIKNIHSELSRRTRMDFELNLQSFMDLRNALAHESPPSVTDVDVSKYMDLVEKWIRAIDRIMYSHVVRASGASLWA